MQETGQNTQVFLLHTQRQGIAVVVVSRWLLLPLPDAGRHLSPAVHCPALHSSEILYGMREEWTQAEGICAHSGLPQYMNKMYTLKPHLYRAHIRTSDLAIQCPSGGEQTTSLSWVPSLKSHPRCNQDNIHLLFSTVYTVTGSRLSNKSSLINTLQLRHRYHSLSLWAYLMKCP